MKTEFLETMGLSGGLNRIIRAGYDLLGLQTFQRQPLEARMDRKAWCACAGGCIHA